MRRLVYIWRWHGVRKWLGLCVDMENVDVGR